MLSLTTDDCTCQADARALAEIAFHGPDLVGKDGPMARVGFDLALVFEEFKLHEEREPGTSFAPSSSLPLVISGDRIRLELIGTGDLGAFQNQLAAVGMTNISRFGSLIDGDVPISNLNQLAALGTLRLARPGLAPFTKAGLVDSQGNPAMRADLARANFGVDGSGVTVGVLSDSMNSDLFFFGIDAVAQDIQSGDLPADTLILQDTIGSDEGRAMAQLIHDLAPGAAIQFATAFGGQTGFAQNILNLAAAGSDVIVDDVGYFAEPFFQDGVIAQAVNAVFDQGIAYFSSAGNAGDSSYESAFVDSGMTLASGARLHDFDPGAGVETLQQITIPQFAQVIGSFQWDQPFASLGGIGSTSDLDISLLGADRTTVIATAMTNNLAGDALELFSFFNDGSVNLDGDDQPDTTFFVRIELVSGPAPGLLKYVEFNGSATIDTFGTASSTDVGHPNTRGAMGVAAAAFFQTPAFGTSPPVLNDFSSRGGTPILFDTFGSRLATPFNPNSPQVTGVDGANTTFFGFDAPQDADGFPNFFGTSAAAPHVAAVAALMIDLSGGSQGVAVQSIYSALMDTAMDITSRADPFSLGGATVTIPNGVGFDTYSGHGLVDAVAALQLISARISIGDVAVFEGDSGTTDAVFTVSFAGTIAETVTVAYTTVDGSAVAPDDYLAQSGNLTFNVGGPTAQFITVKVVGDLVIEPNETFLIRLSDVMGGILGRAEAVGTILNDDVELSIDDVTVIEGDAGTKDALFTVLAAGTINRTVTLGYSTVNATATAAADYLARGGTLAFPPGTSSATITVPVVGDRLDEIDETFFVMLTGAVNAHIVDAQGLGTIIDNDPLPAFYVGDAYLTTTQAGLGSAVFTVALDAPSGREVTVAFGTADGSAADGVHYMGQNGLLNFTPGTTTRLVSVPVVTDGAYAPNLKFFLNLLNPTNSNLADPQGAATIIFAPEPTLEFIIDDGGLGYTRSFTGWTTLTNTLAYQLDYDYAPAGNGSATATWNFNDIPNGSYQVFARWIPFNNRATNAPFTILDGTTPIATVLVNQQAAPAGDLSNGITWQSLGTFETTVGALGVRLANNANGYVIADAVRIVANGIPPQVPEMDVAGFDHSIRTGDVTPAAEDATDFGEVPMLVDSAVHVFTITNTGNAPLHLTGSPPVVISGAHAAEFTILSQPAAVLAPGGKSTFSIIFHPLAGGLRTALVTIANNDDTEHPYEFVVQGTAGEPPPPPGFAHNAALPEDVNGDQAVSPRDLLIIVNSLAAQAQAPAAAPLVASPAAAPAANAASTYYVDVNGDRRLSPVDALWVINYLLTRPAAAPSAAPTAAGVDAVASALGATSGESADEASPMLALDTAAVAADGVAPAGQPPQLLSPASVGAALEAEQSFDPLVEAAELDPLLVAL